MNGTPERDPTGFISAYDRLSGKQPSELQQILHDANRPSVERQAAVSLLAESDLDEGSKTQILVSCLDDADVMVQRVAICDVATDKLSGSVERLRTMMWDESPNQVYVLRSLAALGDSAVIAPCKALLSHQSEEKRLDAVIALGFLDTTVDYWGYGWPWTCLSFFAVGTSRMSSHVAPLALFGNVAVAFVICGAVVFVARLISRRWS